jgi:hypothetical protein
MFAWLGWLLSLLVLPGFLTAAAAGNGDITVPRHEADAVYAQSVQFQLSAASQTEIQKVLLLYGTNGLSCQEAVSRQEMDFTPSREVSLEWELDLSNGRALPPGATVWWQWQITSAGGTALTTEKKSLTIQDRRYLWQTLSQNNVTIQWYQGDTAFGQGLMAIAQSSLGRLSSQMGIHPGRPIWISVYASPGALQGALGGTFTWAGGAAIPEYGSILLGLGPADDAYAHQVIPHELAHLVVEELVYNCLGVKLPTWLSEGLADNAEGRMKPADRDAVLGALQSGRLADLSTLAAGFSPYPDQASLDYAQSGLVVEYLIVTYGPDRLNRVLTHVRDGQLADEALKEVYDLDTTALDTAWRASLGFTGGAASQGGRGAEPTRTPVPTLALRVTMIRPSSPTPTATVTTPVPSLTAIPSPSPSPSPAASPSPSPLGITSTVDVAPVQKGLSSAPVIVSGAIVLAALFFLGLRFAIKKRRSAMKGAGPLGPVSD